MKHYIQITAGRGPVECARAVTLVARELLKAIPDLQLADSEPHNQVDGCFMSRTSAHAADHTVSESKIAPAVLTSQEENMHFEQPKQPVSQ